MKELEDASNLAIELQESILSGSILYAVLIKQKKDGSLQLGGMYNEKTGFAFPMVSHRFNNATRMFENMKRDTSEEDVEVLFVRYTNCELVKD